MAITKIWAANGIKSPIPATPQGDNLVNYDEGFTTPYRTPIKDGGVPIGMGTFNQLMFDITDEIIQNKSTLNQVAQQISSIIDDTQTNLTSTWSSQLIDNKLSAAVAAIIDDNQTTSTLTWSSLKIQAEIGQASTGGGNANIDDNTISTDKVWSSFKTNEMVKGGRTISISNLETQEGSEDTTIANTTANAKMVNLSVKVKTNATTNKYLGDVVVYYNDPSKEILRQSCVSQNIADATELTTAMGMTILDAQDSLIIQSQPASGVIDFWNNVTLIKSTSNVTGSAPVPEPLGEGLLFTAQASSSSVTFNKQGTPTELQLEYQTTIGDVTSGWKDYTLGTRIDLDADDKVSFRNKGTQTITQTDANYHYFTMAGEIKAENDLTYLFSSTGGVDTIAEYGCYKMFIGCAALTQMPDLNATNIGTNGYANMFEGCTKLKTIKPLNATTLANYSYKEMFKNCSGLIISEGSGENQFLSMPAGAPSNAGDNMFVGTGGRFTGSPTASSNYFYNATLPVITNYLRFTAVEPNAAITFSKKGSVTSLDLEYRIGESGSWTRYTLGNAITLSNIGDFVEFRNRGEQITYRGVADPKHGNFSISLGKSGSYIVGTIYGNYDQENTISGNHFFTITNKVNCDGSIVALFSNSMNDQSLGELACAEMFKGCTGLLTAPELPTKNPGGGCYYKMFEGCSKLTTTPKKLPAIVCKPKVFTNQLSGTGSAYYDPSRFYYAYAFKNENLIGLYQSMFKNCIMLETINLDLDCEQIGAGTFMGMFKGCSKLKNAPTFSKLITSLKNVANISLIALYGEYVPKMENSLKTNYQYSSQANSILKANVSWGGTSSSSTPSIPSYPDLGSQYTQESGAFISMFENCYALETANFNIAVQTLSTSAYAFKNMFKNCRKLTVPPTFEGSNINSIECFDEAFSGCSALKISKGSGTTKFFNLTSGSATNMFTGTGGQFANTATAGEYYYN